MIRFLVLPLLAAVAAGAAVLAGYRYLPEGLLPADMLAVLPLAIAAGATALALASYLILVGLGGRLKARAEGLRAFEADMRRRLDRIEADRRRSSADPAGTGLAEGQAPDDGETAFDGTAASAHFTPASRGVSASQGGKSTPGASQAGMSRAEEENDGNDKVIHFDPGARGRSEHLPQARLIGSKLAKALEKNTIEAWFRPVVSLPGRKTRFFEAVAYLTPEAGGDPARDEARAIEPAYSSAPEIDRRMLLQSLKLLRALDRSNKHAGVIWRLHEAALDDAHAFAGIARILDANTALAGRLIARIEHRDYAALVPAQIDRLHRLRELGFTLALANCPDATRARQALESALFSVFILDAARIVAETGEGRPVHRVVTGERGQPEIEVIASGVANEQQAMALIDQDILLAQGDFFSEPRPIRRTDTGTDAARM